MNATDCVELVEKQAIHLYKKYYEAIKRKVNKSIRKAIKEGNSRAFCMYHGKINDNSDIIFKARKDIITWLESLGFYVRKYAFGLPLDSDTYIISWGEEATEQEFIDCLHEKRLKGEE